MSLWLFVLFLYILAFAVSVAGTALGKAWLKTIGVLLLLDIQVFLLIANVTHTESETIRVLGAETYQLAPFLIDENGTPTIADNRYVIVDDEHVLFSYFKEDGITINMDVDADYVGFNGVNGKMSVTIRTGELVTKKKFFSVFFIKEESDCIIYELCVPENVILYRTHDGKFARLEQIVD